MKKILLLVLVLFLIAGSAYAEMSGYVLGQSVVSGDGCTFGNETEETNTTGYAQYRIKISRFQALCDGDLSSINAYIAENQYATFNVMVCLYSDSGGEPDTLIDQSTYKEIQMGTSISWIQYTTSDSLSASFTNGDYYWVGSITNYNTGWQAYGSTVSQALMYTNTSFECPSNWPTESDGEVNGPVAVYINVE